jgi:peptidoglycan/xylan/chitin deacetylase (PgdA/CDA1 family)
MTEPKPWTNVDRDDSQRRERRRVAASRNRERRRLYIVVALVVVLLIALAGLLWPRDGSGAVRGRGELAIPLVAALLHPASAPSAAAAAPPPASLGAPTGRPSTKPVPILMYHVIHSPPPGAKFPELYVPPAEFDSQVRALKDAGFHGVTLDQVNSAWTKGTPLPAKPVVLSFDDGYRSQFAKAMPTLRGAGWPGVLNLQLSLPPSQGGLTESQVRQMVAAGWEVDAHTINHLDLTTLDAAGLQREIAGSRKIIQKRFGVPVNFFCYPAGRYDPTVEASVKQAGFTGATTTQPGWATPAEDPYRLPRVRVNSGTAPATLLQQITTDRTAAAPGPSFGGAGGA